MKSCAAKLISPWRRSFQWTSTLIVLLVPFVRIDGRSLLRLDISTLSLQAFGGTFWIEELYLVLLLGLVLVLGFLLLTLVLGRAWCGWACPQTTLTDAVEGFARLIGVKVKGGTMTASPGQILVLQLFYLALSLLFAANLVWYFVSPYDFFARLADGTLGGGILLTLGLVGGAVYLDLALVRRLMCKEFCPYGRFQTVLVDPGTLTLRFHPAEAHRCIDCAACVRSCPTGIDIRRGYQIECINCGRCLDACRQVMARRQQPGIIRYTFGLQGRGLKALLNPRMLLVTLVFAGLFAGLVVAMVGRPEASLKLARSAGAASRALDDGRQVTFFKGIVTNRVPEQRVLALTASLKDGTPLEVKGPVAHISLAGGEKQRFSFALVSPQAFSGSPLKVYFVLTNRRGQPLVEELAFISAPKD